jgi:hypothetical protein
VSRDQTCRYEPTETVSGNPATILRGQCHEIRNAIFLLEEGVPEERAEPLPAQVGGLGQPLKDLHHAGDIFPLQGVPHTKLHT